MDNRVRVTVCTINGRKYYDKNDLLLMLEYDVLPRVDESLQPGVAKVIRTLRTMETIQIPEDK